MFPIHDDTPRLHGRPYVNYGLIGINVVIFIYEVIVTNNFSNRSAVIAFRNVLRDYPDTKYAEEINYLTIKAQVLYSQNSLETKQEERFTEAITMVDEFTEDYPSSKYLKDVGDLKKQAEQGIVTAKKVLALQQPQEKNNDNKENKKTENE